MGSERTEAVRRRAVLRIPVNMPANVYIGGRPYRYGVCVKDMSTSGLMFHIDRNSNLPEEYELEFRLPGNVMPVKIRVRTANKSDAREHLKVGCEFVDVSERNAEAVHKYILARLNCSRSWKAVNFASFLLFLDSAWRFLVMAVILYYSGTELGAQEDIAPLSAGYSAVLVMYLGTSLTALILNDDTSKGKFILRMSCMAVSFLFIASKSVEHFQSGLWRSGLTALRTVFWAEASLAIYTAFAIMTGAVLLSRMNIIRDSIRTHRSGYCIRRG